MRRSTFAMTALCAAPLLLAGVVLAFGVNRDRPDAIRIVGAEWRPDRPVPPLSLLRERDPVALAIRIPRHQLVKEIVLRTSPVRFELGSCARMGKEGRFYVTELYTDGVPLDRDWAWAEQDSANPAMPAFAEVIALMPREYASSFEGALACGIFSSERWGFTGVRSNAVRLPPFPSAGGGGPERARP